MDPIKRLVVVVSAAILAAIVLVGQMSTPPTPSVDRVGFPVGRDAEGTYELEERRGPAPDDKRSSIPPFRVVLTSPEEDPAPAAQPS